MTGERLVPVQLELREANAFVAKVHRHHKPLHRVRFSVGCADESGKLRGVAMAGRPVARAVPLLYLDPDFRALAFPKKGGAP